MDRETLTFEELVDRLEREQVDWEPRVREQPYRRRRRKGRRGL